MLISIAVNFKSFMEMPSMSVLSLDLEFCIILHISPGLMVPRWRSWELLGERKDSGEMGESGRESANYHSWAQRKLSPLSILLTINGPLLF